MTRILMTRATLIRRHLLIGFLLATALAGLVWFFLFRSWSTSAFVIAWFAGITPTTFFYYGYDKQRAKIGSGRIPEAVLHGLSVMGGSLGAYAGMKWFRHKTIKGRFRILFWGIVILQVAIIALLIRESWK